MMSFTGVLTLNFKLIRPRPRLRFGILLSRGRNHHHHLDVEVYHYHPSAPTSPITSTMAPKFSTIFGYLIALIPAYILVFAPLSRLILGPQGSENDILDTSQLDPNLLSLIDPDEVLDCSSHSYNVHIFSRAPLVIYIESFLSDDEASHMVRERYVPRFLKQNKLS